MKHGGKPSKGSVGVDDPQWVKRRVHGLLQREEVANDRDAEVGQQQTQSNGGHLPNVVALEWRGRMEGKEAGWKRRGEMEWGLNDF